MAARFPKEVGDLGGLTFEEIFEKLPKWTEYVRTWTKATGMFEDLRNYVVARLSVEEELSEHEFRCRQYVRDKFLGDLPEYLLKYVDR